ncbi:MAG: SipW-dependent-type signal peptide-containing protein [Negativibacillus sp.]
MKKKIAAVAVILSLVSIAAMGTMAYFTDSAVAHNVITSGNIDIEVKEWKDTGEVDENNNPIWEEYEDGILAMPGQSVSKIVTVENNDEPAYIRAKFKVVAYKLVDKEQIPIQIEEGAITVPTDTAWVKGEDGWYYYNAPVEKGGVTAPLFSEVQFSGPNMGNEYQGATVEIKISAEAVQAANAPSKNDNPVTSAIDVDPDIWPTQPEEE